MSRRVPKVRVATRSRPCDDEDRARFAWQLHLAQEAWMSKVDNKGSILLALEGGALCAVLAASGKDGRLVRLDGWHRLVEVGGIMALLLAMVSAGLAVFPRLGATRTHRGHYREELLYFGHLRHWEPTELRTRLRRLSCEDQLIALTSQVVRVSKANWIKYRLVQLSLVLALVGTGALSGAVLAP